MKVRTQTNRSDHFRWFFLLLSLAILCLVAGRPAQAMTFSCVESSKYKYIVRLFDGDPRKLAAALGAPTNRIPPAEACRAIIAEGGPAEDDPDRLIPLINSNRGWLDEIYLHSGGGNVVQASRVAVLVRAFWLSTKVLPSKKDFVYAPDFLVAAASPNARAAFEAAVNAVPTKVEAGDWCASACTMILAAGADRDGISHVHRCQIGGPSARKQAEIVDGCLAIQVRSLLSKMGAGDRFISTVLATSTWTTKPITTPRFPGTVQDALANLCNSDGAQLDDVARLLRYAIAQGGNVDTTALKASLATVEHRRGQANLCIARMRTRDRLASFDKLCRRGCSAGSLRPMIQTQLKELVK